MKERFFMALQSNSALFTSDTIRRIIEDNQKTAQADRVGPNIGFFPDGRHVIRWFLDPTGKLFREVVMGKVGKKKFVCPDFANKFYPKPVGMSDYPVCEMDRRGKELKTFKDKCRYHCIVYGFLYETKTPSDYWKVGQPYAIIGNSYLKKGLMSMLENLQDIGMDMLLSMLTPTSKGFFSTVTATDTHTSQGNVSIQVLAQSVDAIDLQDWWVPLSEVYAPNFFDEEVYEEAVRAYVSSYSLSSTPQGGQRSILDEVEEETLPTSTTSTARPMVTPTVSASLGVNSILEQMEETELTPRVVKTPPTSTKKSALLKRKTTIELPSHITLDMLPEGCPGWGNYTMDLDTCALCGVNLDCMSALDSSVTS